MTVLIVPSWYKTDSNPTMGSFFREQALMLKNSGIDVIVADATFQGKTDYTSARCFKMQCTDDEGLLTYSYVIPAMGIGRMQSAGAGIFLMNLRRIYKRIVEDGHKIDLIHAHSYLPAGLASVKLGREKDIPVIVTEHASDVLTKKLVEKRVAYLRETVYGAKAFICVGEALKQAVMGLVDDNTVNIKVIPNAVDKRFVLREKLATSRFTFVSVGNLLPSKRFDLTIKAFAILAKEYSNCELKIIGDGILRDELRRLARQYEVENNVQFLGRVSREQVFDELSSSHVFVLPSDYETFGVVYVEAMACGLPVIGTRNGGAEDIITEKEGILIDRNDLGQLVVAMKRMFLNYADYDRIEIAERCQKRYGESVVVQELLDVYGR